jgi:hypothetical protein
MLGSMRPSPHPVPADPRVPWVGGTALFVVVLLLLGGMSWSSATPGRSLAVAHPIPDGAAAGDATYPVNFTTSGALRGAQWNLTVLDQTWTTTGSSLLLHEPNGSYTYSAYSPVVAEFSASSDGYDNGSFSVAGMAVTVGLSWVQVSEGPALPSPHNATSTASALSPDNPLTVELVALFAVVVVAVLAVVARGRKVPPVAPNGGAPPRTGPAAPAGDGRPPSDGDRADPLGHML